MDIYLPIAGISENLVGLLLLGLISGMFSGLLGIGGGIIVTPVLIFLGISPAIAAATSANQMVGTSVSGVYTHLRYGTIDSKLGIVLIAGSLLGGVVGVELLHHLPRKGPADLLISSTYVAVCGLVGLSILLDAAGWSNRKNRGIERFRNFLFGLSFKMTFERTGLSVSVIPLLGAGFITGFMASIMGIGGGFLIVPILVYLLGLPMLLVTGTSLFQISITSILVTLLQSSLNQSVDLILAMVLLAGSSIGVVLGIKIAKHQAESRLKILLALLILSVTIAMIYHISSGIFSLKEAGPIPAAVSPVGGLAGYALAHPLIYGSLSVLGALFLGLLFAVFIRKGESFWNR
ncbi:MAG TPA: sulfite exporter TauE/SafE family protein [Nitrospiria bacterium]|nr:sulfite exporter TauE/SafE family protein [Nitrospiria bacterium]